MRSHLTESEEHRCPDANCNEKDISPETLIPNRFLRTAVMNFKNETGYAKRPLPVKVEPVKEEPETVVSQHAGGELADSVADNKAPLKSESAAAVKPAATSSSE